MSLKLVGSGQPVVPDKPQAMTDANRPLGANAVLNGRPVRWAGQGWGWQSEKSFQKLESSGKLNRPWWRDPVGAIRNELRHIGNQARQTDDNSIHAEANQRMRAAAPPGIPLGGRIGSELGYGTISQTSNNISAAMTVGVAENAQKFSEALRQRVTGGDGNPEGGRVGGLIERVAETGYQLMGATPPGRQNEFEQSLDATARSASTSIIGTAVGAKIIPALGSGLAGAALTGGARWALGELLSTYLDDNRPGNLFNLVGALTGNEIPLSVDIGNDDWIDAATKSLIPNALPGTIISALGGAGQLARNPGAIGAGMKNSRRWLRSQRTVADISDARTRLERAGITQTDPVTGAAAWRQAEADFKRSIGIEDEAAPAAAPATEPRPIPTIEGELTTENFGKAQPAPLPQVEDVSVDPWSIRYDPELPEADVVFNLVRDLDDDQLQMLVAQPGPVVERLDQMLQAREAMPVRPELQRGAVMAPSDNIAERLGPDGQPVPYEATLEAMPMDTLRSVAAPDNNPELAQLIGDLTGRNWEEFTKADIIEGLAAYREQTGQSLLVRDWNQGMRPTAEIFADPERFQFKQGVNEKGEQLGSSLAGVERWDTNAEGVLDVWTDPADGRTYVVNGHNRRARAQQLGVPTLPVRELPAATAQEARAMGALSNIQAGQGTVFDAAKFMRDSGITSPEQLQQLGVPMSSGNAARGLALAQLPDNIFQAAVDGRLSVGKAAALGGSGLDDDGMQAAFKALGARDMSDAKFSEVIQQVQTTPRMKVDDGQTKLPWGDEPAILLLEQKADLVVKIRQDLLKDKRFFGTAAKGAGRLEQAGNKINVAGNKAIAADTDMVLRTFDQLKYTEGPVSDLLNDGARQIAEGAKPGVIADRIRGDIAEAVRRSLDEQGMPTQRPAGAARADDGFDLEAERADSARATQEADALFAEAEGLLAGMQENTSRMAEGARRMLEVSAGIEDIDGALPTDRIVPSPRALTPEERAALQIQAVQKAANQAEIRPPETPIPELPDGPAVRPDVARADLEARGQLEPGSPSAQAAADELRLGLEFAERDAQMQAIAREGARDAMDYELLTFEQKKAMGMADGYDLVPPGQALVHGTSQKAADSIMEGGFRPSRTKAGGTLLGDGVYMATDSRYAGAYGKVAVGGEVPEGARILDLVGQGKTVSGFAEEIGVGRPADVFEGERYFSDAQQAQVRQWALDNGYDGIKFDPAFDEVGAGASEVVIYNLDLANQMVGSKAALAPAPVRAEPMQLTDGGSPDFALPQELTRSAPRYGQARIKFGNDLDKAAYILANDAVRPSKAAPKFRAAIEAAGLDVSEVIAHGKKVKAAIKQAAGGGAAPQKSGTIDLPAQRFDQSGQGPQPRTKAADLEARKQIDANNKRMDDVRRKAQQEGC